MLAGGFALAFGELAGKVVSVAGLKGASKDVLDSGNIKAQDGKAYGVMGILLLFLAPSTVSLLGVAPAAGAAPPFCA